MEHCSKAKLIETPAVACIDHHSPKCFLLATAPKCGASYPPGSLRAKKAGSCFLGKHDYNHSKGTELLIKRQARQKHDDKLSSGKYHFSLLPGHFSQKPSLQSTFH